MIRRAAHWLRACWSTVPEPRYTSTVYAIAYGLFVLTGAATLIWQPQTLAGIFGKGGMTVVGYMFLTGGLAGMYSGWREWWELERWALAAMLAGLGAYAYIVFALHATSTSSQLTQAGVVLIAACLLIHRLGMIWRYPYKPRG